MRATLLSVAALAAMIPLSCSSDESSNPSAPVDAGLGDAINEVAADSPTDAPTDVQTDAPPPVHLDWTDCEALHSYPPTPTTVKSPARCSIGQLPQSLDANSAQTTSIFVKRLAPASTPASLQLWLLNGGPGTASAELEPLMIQLRELLPTAELFTTDMRGVGKSSRLSCKAEVAGISSSNGASCAKEVAESGSQLSNYTTTLAAHDVLELIRSTRVASVPTYVYGMSYGTFWAHRLLQIKPDAVDGIILDSIAGPTSDFSSYTADANSIAKDFFALCAKDSTCSAKLGNDPWSKVESFFGSQDKSCPTSLKLTKDTYRMIFAIMMRKVDARPFVPALLYRLLRCSAEDQQAIKNLLTFMSALPKEPAEDFGDVLHTHVSLSELWPDNPRSAAELKAIDDTAWMANGRTADTRALWDIWPRTPKDPWSGTYASTRVPMLMLHGDLDPQTHPRQAKAFGEKFRGEHQTFVSFPLAPHGILSQTLPTSKGTPTCGVSLMISFLKDPKATLDTSCVGLQPGIDFGDNAEMASEVFGQGSMWEAVPPVSPSSTGLSIREKWTPGVSGH